MATHTYDEVHRSPHLGERNSFIQTLTGTVARFVFALPFLLFGLNHFVNAEQMVPMVPIPGGFFWIYLTGAALMGAAVALMFNKLRLWAGIGLAVLLATFALGVHLPVVLAEGAAAMDSVVALLKDTALAGAALYLAGHPHR